MTRIFSADWILSVSSPPIRNGAIAVRDDSIVDVGPKDELHDKHRDSITEARHFDHAAILPGLVNVHTHLELTILRGRLEGLEFRDWLLGIVGLRQGLTNDDLMVSARLGAIESIKAGITTVADTCESGIAVDALNESGQRGIVYQEIFGVDPVTAEQNLRDVGEKVRELRKRTGKMVSVGISPHSPYTVSPKLYTMVADYAGKEALPMAIHAAESVAESDFVSRNEGVFAENYRSRGVEWNAKHASSIRYLFDLGVLNLSPLLIHCVQTDEKDAELIATTKSKIAHCPKSNARFGHGIAPLKEMISAGVKVGLGTDSVVSNNVCDVIDEARTACLFSRARTGSVTSPTPAEMIRMATLGGAEALGMDAMIGSLEPGKQADFCAIDLSAISTVPVDNPETAIIFSTSARDVVATGVAGQLIYDCGDVKTIDEDRTRADAHAIANRLS